MRKLILKNLGGKKVLFFFIVANIVYLTMLLVTIPNVMQYSNGIKVLDMMPGGYDMVYVQGLFNALGAEGRAVYMFPQIALDMIYPALFAISFCLVFAYFLNKINKARSAWLSFAYLPLIAGVFDYMENIGIISMLNSFPDIDNNLVFATNLATLIKSGCTTLFFLALLVLLVMVGIKAIKK